MRKVERGVTGYYKPGADRIDVNRQRVFKGTMLIPGIQRPPPHTHEMVDCLKFFSNFTRHRFN